MEIMLIFFGGLLILTSVVGGGFELKEVKIPKIGWFARLPALLIGLTLVIFGVALVAAEPTTTVGGGTPSGNVAVVDEPVGGSDQIPEPAPSLVLVTVWDTLGTDQEWEELTLYIEGVDMGTFYVDEANYQMYLEFELPQPGEYAYELVGQAYWVDGSCESVYGSGFIVVEDGASFDVVYPGSESCQAELVA